MFLVDYDHKLDYRILVSRAKERDEEPLVDLGQVLHNLYDVAGYDLCIDYRQEPTPRLSKEDALWADELLREAGWR